jgi:hypothetical protein
MQQELTVTKFGMQVPDQFIFDRKEKYLHVGDGCIKPGGCAGVLYDIKEVNKYCRRGHEDWLMCDHCNARYKPIQGKGYVWADAGYYGYRIQYEE